MRWIHLLFFLLVAKTAFADEIGLLGAKWPENSHLSFDVGKMVIDNESRPDALSNISNETNEWISYLDGSGLSVSYTDVGNVPLPLAPDQRNTLCWVEATGNWAGKVFPYAYSDCEWSYIEQDVRFKISTNWCWLNCPGNCGLCYKLDYVTFARHETGHYWGFDHCPGCPSSVSVMTTPGPVNCEEWSLGSLDRQQAGIMYDNNGDTYEPNDCISEAQDLGNIDLDDEYPLEIWNEYVKMSGLSDHDCYHLYVAGNVSGWVLGFYASPYGYDSDLVFQVYKDGSPRGGTVNQSGPGGDESAEFFAEHGQWEVCVWSADYLPSEEDYLIYVEAYRAYAGTPDNPPEVLTQNTSPLLVTMNGSVSVLGTEQGTLSIFDAGGRLVESHQVTPPATINTERSGIFFATFQTSTMRAKAKLVVVR